MNILSPSAQLKVEQALVAQGLMTQTDLSTHKSMAAQQKLPILTYLINNSRITDEQLTKALAEVNNLPYVNLSNFTVDQKILGFLSKETCERYMAVPIGEMQSYLIVAMVDADNVQAVDFLSSKIGRPLKAYAASESGIRHVLSQYAGAGLEHNLGNIGQMLSTPEPQSGVETRDQKAAAEKAAQTIVQDSPIAKALSSIMEYAAANKASDVHVESLEKELKIRCRVDGVMREIMRLPKSAEPALVSRIKILSNLKIDEHRIPQDGQFTIKAAGREIDLRVAISPVVWGEQVVLRLLDKTDAAMTLAQMGYNGRAQAMVEKALRMPHGMILTSGPTGSGKTTSMYAMIQAIKNDGINVVTLEDPVEYKIDGVNQIQVNADVGLTFATGLRSILRQDPDVVMVGEIRDKETANLAVQAALTGHLVFSTLHTNSAAGILPRLLDMGIEPFLIASTVHTIIGQRLVRKIAPGGEQYQSLAAETEAIKTTMANILPKTAEESVKISAELGYQNLPLAGQNAYTLIKPKPTADNKSGLKGRLGIYEVFEVSDKIQDLIVKRPTSSIIQKMAQEQGMIIMKQDGYLKALAGLTTLQEVNRVASAES